MNRGPKIICLRRKVLAAVRCAAAAFLMCWVAASPEVVGAASTERQLPIYCVEKDSIQSCLRLRIESEDSLFRL